MSRAPSQGKTPAPVADMLAARSMQPLQQPNPDGRSICATASVGLTLKDEQVLFASRWARQEGARLAVAAAEKLVSVTRFVELKRIKDTKAYKGMLLEDLSGKVVTVTTWDEFCRAIGSTRETIDRELCNLTSLGEEFFESCRQLGISQRDMRELRTVPSDERSAALKAIENGDKDAARKAILALVEDHRLQADAKDRVAVEREDKLRATRAALEQAGEELAEARVRLQQLAEPPSPTGEQQQSAACREAANAAELALRKLAKTVIDTLGAPASEPAETAARQSAEWVAHLFADLLAEMGITPSFAADIQHPWQAAIDSRAARAGR